MVTSKDVAKLAGVSHTTVSRAFRKDAKIKKETYDRIMKISRELGYVPNQIASSLRQKKTKNVGIIISHGFNPLFLDLTHSIETELARHGYRLLLSFDDGDLQQQQNILQSLASAQVDVILFTPLAKSEEDLEQLHTWMVHTGIHFIQLIGDPFEDITSFKFDDEQGAYLGTRHLLSKGHRNILLIGGVNRVNGYLRAYEQLQYTPAFPYRDLTGSNDAESYSNIKAALLAQKPTAVFPVSTSLSYLTYEVIAELKLRIPEDISFLAFDDERWLQLLRISVIGHPTQALASSIVREILSYEENSEEVYPSSTSFKPFLLERSSVRAFNEETKSSLTGPAS
ncbi:MAG: LacI family DNA-binding transcriptional regulator [Eubacteriales bacterium]|nr:LacI family DNA-binding transcriptional regulator [Eubacteriales bacterium]